MIAILLICAAQAVAQKPATPVPLMKGQPTSQGFSIVLVLGDMQAASSAADNVPAAARKALADMKDFLPYKGYRLLDAQWVLGSQRATTRLRGVDDQEYEVTVRASNIVLGTKLNVSFRLAEPGGAGYVGADDARARKMAELDRMLQAAREEAARTRERLGDKNATTDLVNAKVTEIRREMEALEMASGRGRAIIDTSFAMDIGETVVVGTSRLRGGDKALIALLTAVPKGRD
jgi:hypothetical protein